MTSAADRLLIVVVAVAVIAAVVAPRIPQDPAYHDFADTRPLLGIPNSFDVLSNVPFAIVGLMGLAALRPRSDAPHPGVSDPWERWPYVALFAGVALTAAGSSYYHLAPDNQRLVWDRLPMTVGFMGLLTAILVERVNVRLGRALFVPLLVFGACSVAYWYWTESRGAGDLRPYALVQFGSLLVIVLALFLYRGRYAGDGYLVAGLAAYALAKVFEFLDRAIFDTLHIVSGHTLKHLIAAGGLACMVAMLRARSKITVELRSTSPG